MTMSAETASTGTMSAGTGGADTVSTAEALRLVIAMHRLLRGLRRAAGLASREADPADGRAARVLISENGRCASRYAGVTPAACC